MLDDGRGRAQLRRRGPGRRRQTVVAGVLRVELDGRPAVDQWDRDEVGQREIGAGPGGYVDERWARHRRRDDVDLHLADQIKAGLTVLPEDDPAAQGRAGRDRAIDCRRDWL